MNVDQISSADVVHNLDVLPWPFEDDSVQELHSSHCLEHVSNFHAVIREIARVCVVGSVVTIKVPHFHSDMAMCPGHLHTISETQMRHFDEFPHLWDGCKKRLTHVSTQLMPSFYFKEARSLAAFRSLNDQQLMRYVPGTCHEYVFNLKCVPVNV